MNNNSIELYEDIFEKYKKINLIKNFFEKTIEYKNYNNLIESDTMMMLYRKRIINKLQELENELEDFKKHTGEIICKSQKME